MKTINKDITTVEKGIIVHQVNCQGMMGSGVAKVIREKWPIVYEEYKKFYDAAKTKGGWRWNSSELLGQLQFVKVSENLFVGNLFGQNKYGYDKKRYTSYAGWEKAIPNMVEFFNGQEYILPIYFPLNVGCDRGGGDFRIISALIEEYCPDAIFCKI